MSNIEVMQVKISTAVLYAAMTSVCITTASGPAKAQKLNNSAVLGGTLNVVLANKNGAVVLTDSMLSDESGPVPVPHPEIPGQKLFQLDDKTVCAIAGFVSAPGLFPEFSPSVSAVVAHFSEELKQNPRQSLEFKLTALAMLMGQNISAIAALRTAANKPIRAKNYLSTITLVGFDRDGILKIGQVQLAANPEHLERGAVVTGVQIASVGDNLIFGRAGKWETAAKLMNDPGSKPLDKALARLKDSVASDGGSSLTLDEMRGIALSLVSYTAQADCTVGGDKHWCGFRCSLVSK
jgi:hypothetical protein